jgi:hypothetical protein
MNNTAALKYQINSALVGVQYIQYVPIISSQSKIWFKFNANQVRIIALLQHSWHCQNSVGSTVIRTGIFCV